MGKKTNFRWTLYIGLPLWLVFHTISLFIPSDYRGSIVPSDYSIKEFLLTGLLIPIVEELTFRFWCIRKKYAFVISNLLIAASLYFYLIYLNNGCMYSPINWVVALFLFFFITYGFFQISQKNQFISSTIVATSILFAVLHYGNFFPIVTLESSTIVIGITGFALVACYIALNYGIVWSIILHIGVNSLIFICAAFMASPSPWYSTKIETDECTMIIEPIVWQSHNPGVPLYSDTIIAAYFLPELAYNLSNEKNLYDTSRTAQKTLYVCKRDDGESPFQITLIHKKKGDMMERINHTELVKEMERRNLISIDTSYVPMHMLTWSDVENIPTFDTGFHSDIYELYNILRSKYHVPVMLDNDINPHYPVDYETEKLFTLDSAEFLKYVEKHCGLAIVVKPHSKMMVVTFSTYK